MKRIATLALLATGLAQAGGFWITSKAPAAGIDALVLVQVLGCHNPEDAVLTATAEGIVNGQRRSLPLEFRPAGKGSYVVKKQALPAGTWVLALTARLGTMVTSELIPLAAGGEVPASHRGQSPDKPGKFIHKQIRAADVESALRQPAS